MNGVHDVQLFLYTELHNSIHMEEMSLFLKYFYQYFLGDKWDKSIKSQETQETRNLLR